MIFRCVNLRAGAKLFLSVTFTFLFLTIFIGKDLRAQEAKDMFGVCAACHTIGKGKLVGPDLKGVSARHEEAWLIKFIQNSQAMVLSGDETAVKLFNENNKIPMPPNDFTDEQVRSLLSYIENYVEEPAGEETAGSFADSKVAEHKKLETSHAPTKDRSRNYFSLILISICAILLSLSDLFILKMIRWKVVHIIIMLAAVFVMGGIVVVEIQNLGRQQYYSPEQPIAFSHKIHAGQNKIDCQYCHTTAEESKHAGIPSVQLCMNCHNVVKSGSQTGTTEIAKIYEALESGKPIEWIKVHNVPDHVYFNHAQHVNVGKLECQQCHGKVEEMDQIVQESTLGMGWCIECHRTTEVQFTTNDFYKNYTKLHEELNTGKRSRIVVEDIGGNDCQKCHY
ncbi:MAG: c-type cytochrome [Bacteroidales bacterium]|nr:c-type cytochrome [Bacteroidales bacterium]MCF8458153.1 c-type cytochrome [Bacteroidales bacterium]